MPRDLPSVHDQTRALCRWFIQFRDYRGSEAAITFSRWRPALRRSVFRLLREQHCIEYRNVGEVGAVEAGWYPVKDYGRRRP